MPDLIEYNWSEYSGGPGQALDDDVIISLNDYLEDHAPNYYDYMEREKAKAHDYTWKLQAISEDGRYYGFNVLDIGTKQCANGIFVRADLLKKWGMEYQLFGVEGDTYTMVERDGEMHYQYTDKVVKNYEAEGLSSISESLYRYMLPTNHPSVNQHPDYFYGYYELDRQKEAFRTWNIYSKYAIKHALPRLSYSEAESREITDIKEIAEAELEVAICDIILGKKSINTYDDAIKAAKANGYDRWIEIVQGLYDRFCAKK